MERNVNRTSIWEGNAGEDIGGEDKGWMRIRKNAGRKEELNDNTTDRRWKNISTKNGRDKSAKNDIEGEGKNYNPKPNSTSNTSNHHEKYKAFWEELITCFLSI
jgi:hypothetical protein